MLLCNIHNLFSGLDNDFTTTADSDVKVELLGFNCKH